MTDPPERTPLCPECLSDNTVLVWDGSPPPEGPPDYFGCYDCEADMLRFSDLMDRLREYVGPDGDGWTPSERDSTAQHTGPNRQPHRHLTGYEGGKRCRTPESLYNAQNESEAPERQSEGWGPVYVGSWAPSHQGPPRRRAIMGSERVGSDGRINTLIWVRGTRFETETRNRRRFRPGHPLSSPRDQNSKSPGVKGVTLAGPSARRGSPRGHAPTPRRGESAASGWTLRRGLSTSSPSATPSLRDRPGRWPDDV